MNKEELYLAEDNLAAEIEEISEFVFNHAELAVRNLSPVSILLRN
mgnify:CR=1 FL=1